LAPPIDLTAFKAAFVAEGVSIRPFRNMVYLTPALTINPAELDVAIAPVKKVYETLRRVTHVAASHI
jgi:adenosylmethionine-8-amino-7-oxononanoate aminotransferase